MALAAIFLVFLFGCTQPAEPEPMAPPAPEPPAVPSPEPSAPEPPPEPGPEPESVSADGIIQSQCEEGGGRWNECGSACRGAPEGTSCTQVCVAYCECGGIAGFNCPAGYECTNYLPEGAADAMGICEPIDETEESEELEEPEEEEWVLEDGVRIAGNYADADIVDLGNGNYRMYYSLEPEVEGFNGQVYSSVSSDGISWTRETGTRKESVTFPSVIKLPDGRYRMYFQNAGVIKSAISSDGLTWQDESGTRMDTGNNLGLDFEYVLAPTVIDTGSEYMMVYSGAMDERYSAERVPNSETHVLMWATSEDGLTFEKKGMAVDSRNPELKGWVDGPEFVKWDDDGLRLYFWSYRGVYHVTYEDEAFSDDVVFDFTTATDPNVPFPQDPPGDPTITKMEDGYRMYFGIHTEGIYSAILATED